MLDIPDPVYNGLFGAAVAFLAAWLTAWRNNAHALKRQKTELNATAIENTAERTHSAEQKELDRVHTLKKEAYLPLMDAFQQAVAFVAAIATAPRQVVEECVAMANLGSQCAKVSIIAPPDLLEPVMQGFIQLQGMYTRLVHKRFQLNEICDAVSLNETKRARVNQQHDLAAKRLDALIDQKKPDPLMPLIQQHIEGHLAETKLLLEEYSHLLDQRTRVQFEAIELITTELGGASEINTNILLAARRDLNLPIDESWYRKFTKEGELTAKQLTQEFVRDLKAKAIPPDNEAK